MSVDAFVTKVGLKMVSTVHSRTSVQGKVSLTEEKSLNVEFDLPEEQMDIFSVKYVPMIYLPFTRFFFIFRKISLIKENFNVTFRKIELKYSSHFKIDQ